MTPFLTFLVSGRVEVDGLDDDLGDTVVLKDEIGEEVD